MENEIGRMEATEHANCQHGGCAGIDVPRAGAPEGHNTSAKKGFDRMEAGHGNCPHGCPTGNATGQEDCTSGNASGFDRIDA